MSRSHDGFRSERDMAHDTSLCARVDACAIHLMRAKGRFRDRLPDIALELEPLQPTDFTEEAATAFVALQSIVEARRTSIPVKFGHFTDPTPAERDKIAELALELLRLVAAAEARHTDD